MATSRFAFDVQTAHSAHVALSAVPLASICGAGDLSRTCGVKTRAKRQGKEAADEVAGVSDTYEIVIAQNKTYTALLRGGVEVATPSRNCELRELRGDSWRGFWVDIENDGCIRFGRRGEAEPLLEWHDPTPSQPKFIAFYTGPGSGGGPWRFYSLKGVPQPSSGETAVFSYQLGTCPEVDKPFRITIHGANLPPTGDCLKVISGPEWINAGPSAGSKVVRNLEGTDTMKTATITFTEPSKYELVVAYNPGSGYEVVRPDRTNAFHLMASYIVGPVFSTPERLLRPLRGRTATPEQPESKKAFGSAERDVVPRWLYNRTPEAHKKAVTAEQVITPARRRKEEEYAQEFYYGPLAHVVASAQALEQKYLPKPTPSPKLDKVGVENFNERFFYRKVSIRPANTPQQRTSTVDKKSPTAAPLPSTAPGQLEPL